MSRPEVPKISLKAVERKRAELNSQRTLLHRTLRDAPSIEDALDVIRALNAALYPPRKEADGGGSSGFSLRSARILEAKHLTNFVQWTARGAHC